MKKFAGIILIFVVTAALAAATIWKNDLAHSQLTFTVTHLGIVDVTGTFNDFEATITSEKDDFSDAEFTLTAKVGSIDTRVEERDTHLKSADFFDAEKYPEITFQSTSVESDGTGLFKVTGDLTMHGVTQPVILDLMHSGTVENPMNQKQTAGFQVLGEVSRSDFNIGGDFPETVISDAVRIKIDAEFVK